MPQTDVGRSEDLLAELSAWVGLETPDHRRRLRSTG